MARYSEAFVAFDVAKKKHAVAIAEGGRTGEVRFLGDVENSPLPIEQLTSFLGLVPAESSTGDTIRRKGLTLAGNRRTRRALVEAAWTYRYPARVSETLRARLEGLPRPVRGIAWKSAGPPVRPLSPPQRHGQEAACRRGRDRPRDSRFLVGDRAGGRADVRRLPCRCPESGAEHEVGNSRR